MSTMVPMVGVTAFDYDLNGTVDLLATPAEPDFAVQLYGGFATTAGRVYVETGTASGLSVGKASGAVVSDFNADGDPDVYLGRPQSAPFFYQNVQGAGVDAPVNHWVGIKLVAPHGGNNREGVGSVVTVSYPGPQGAMVQVQQVDGGSGRGEQQGQELRFGLGQEVADVAVMVKWPDGWVQPAVIASNQLEQVHTITEAAHAPGIVAGSFTFVAQPRAGGAVDLVARWTTQYNSEKGSLEVTVENYGTLPPQCEGISGSLRLKAGDPGVTTSVKATAGGYVNEVRYSLLGCQTVCSYRGKDPRCAVGTQQSALTVSKKATISVCVQ